MNSSLKKTLQSLHQKADQFFDTSLKKYPKEITCKQKCSGCCHQQFSVFPWEAWLITTWFEELSEEKKSSLKKIWSKKQSKHPELELFPCAFLYEDQCSIYETRPLICRTQGLALKVSEFQIDWCPLNFQNNSPAQEDSLNLETLNTMSSTLQKFWQQHFSNEKHERITLVNLKETLLKK